MPPHASATAVLLSGGLDSAVLLAEEARSQDVLPIYVAVGLAWEPSERDAVELLLASRPTWSSRSTDSPALTGKNILPLATLTVDMSDVYPAAHWARVGRPPGYDTPDKDVYLPGRNIVLLAKAGILCATAGIGRIVMGTLGHNPFPDATPGFRTAIASALSLGLDHPLQVDAPYAQLGKADVIRRGLALGVPFELTLSCMSPVGTGGKPPAIATHCGTCSKCRERHQAFVEAGITDPTPYADFRFVGRLESGV